MPTLFRVILRNTRAAQRFADETMWDEQVIYCGRDWDEALKAYTESRKFDEEHEFGGVRRETISSNVPDPADGQNFPLYRCRGCHATCPAGMPLAERPPPVSRHKKRRKKKPHDGQR